MRAGAGGWIGIQFKRPLPWNSGRVKPKTFWNFFCNVYSVVPFSFGICWKICRPYQLADFWMYISRTKRTSFSPNEKTGTRSALY